VSQPLRLDGVQLHEETSKKQTLVNWRNKEKCVVLQKRGENLSLRNFCAVERQKERKFDVGKWV
jgi:hypothetical protein